jgi:hypothetical protein
MTEFKYVKDSGKREDMETGSRRDSQDGKSRPDLMNPLVLRRVGQHFANGCDKYGEKNFELGQKTSRYRASLGRHLLDYDEGLTDEDHLSAIIWNAMGIMMNQEFVERGLYAGNIDDFSDYTTRKGFEGSVGDRARAHNDALRRKGSINAQGQLLIEDKGTSVVEAAEPDETVQEFVADKTGFCMSEYKDSCKQECMTWEKCSEFIYKSNIQRYISELEEKAEKLEDTPEVPPCFGACRERGCGDCDDGDECDTYFCETCGFDEECSVENTGRLEKPVVHTFEPPDADSLGTCSQREDKCPGDCDGVDCALVFKNSGCNGCMSRNKLFSMYPCKECFRNNEASFTSYDYFVHQDEC